MRFAGIFILDISVAGVAMPACALMFKKGQVVGSDGEIHARLIAANKLSRKGQNSARPARPEKFA